MKILFIFRFFHFIWFADSENLCFILILKEKMFLIFNIVHFPNFETSASSYNQRTLISAESAHYSAY